MKKLLFTLLSALFALGVAAAEPAVNDASADIAIAGTWEMLGRTTTGAADQRVYVESSRIHRNGQWVVGESLVDLVTSRANPKGKPYLSMHAVEGFDCNKRTFTVFSFKAYAQNLGAGEVVLEEGSAEDAKPPVFPASRGQAAQKRHSYFCYMASKQGLLKK